MRPLAKPNGRNDPPCPKQPDDVAHVVGAHANRLVARTGPALNRGRLHRLDERLDDRCTMAVADPAIEFPLDGGHELVGDFFAAFVTEFPLTDDADTRKFVDPAATCFRVQASKKPVRRQTANDLATLVKRHPGSTRKLLRRERLMHGHDDALAFLAVG